jgi:carboxyl-terminal processing protease
MRWRALVGVGLAAAFGYAAFRVVREQPPTAPKPQIVAAPAKPDAGKAASEDEEKSPLLHPPTGKLASLTCAQASAIVKEVRDELAFVPSQPTAAEMASATKDWIDPHGHWAVAPDATPYAAIDAEAAALLAEIAAGSSCPAALRVGKKLASWMEAQRSRYDARVATGHGDATRALADGLDVTARDAGSAALAATALTDELGDRAGSMRRAFGEPVARYLQDARNRYFPDLTAEAWAEVVLAAAVRGWVEQVDAHGAWAPYGEEAAVHDVDLDQDAPARLWTRATRTLLGVRIDDGALAPLATGDVVLEVDGMPLAGLPVEQLDELALTAADGGEAFDVVVMREGDRAPRLIRVDESAPEPRAKSAPTSHPYDLPTDIVPYGSGEVAIVTIPDIYDDLGELFERALSRARSPKLAGVVLDLRGDGGGSTEGAIDTLGVFLPGARLFPMRNRKGTVEIDRAPSPAPDDQWAGPVATLVDAGTASAAEMLAGALAAYKRGPSVGAPTYGKGCAQEYLDDDAHAGLLRVTTLLFALPDGSPVQRVGLTPTIAFPFRADDLDGEREAKLLHSPDPWTGPDVRDRAWVTKAAQFAWPAAGGHVGPCKDERACKAIAMLGEPRARVVARKSDPQR